MGLFIGASFVSLVELIDWFIIRPFHERRKRRVCIFVALKATFYLLS